MAGSQKNGRGQAHDIVERIYEVYYGLMIYIAKGILDDHALAEDAVQESLIKLLSQTDKIDDVMSDRTKGFVAKIVKHTAIDILRKRKSQRIDFDGDETVYEATKPLPSQIDLVLSAERYAEIIEAIKSLTPTLRAIAELALLHEMDQKDIAEILGISHASVRTGLTRAKKILRQILAGGEEL